MLSASVLASKRNAIVLGVLVVALAGTAARGDEPRLSISGYDPVAYFTDGRPIQGNADFEYLWHRSRWRFASSEHRDLFSKNPEHYAPQYDGYCAMGASRDAAAHKDTVDPNAWTIVDTTVRAIRKLAQRISHAVAAERRHRRALESDLFGGRYTLCSKNDDDFPVVR